MEIDDSSISFIPFLILAIIKFNSEYLITIQMKINSL